MSTAQQVLTGPMIQSGTSRVSLTVIQERARKKKWKNSFRAWLLLLPSLIFLADLSWNFHSISYNTESDFQFL